MRCPVPLSDAHAQRGHSMTSDRVVFRTTLNFWNVQNAAIFRHSWNNVITERLSCSWFVGICRIEAITQLNRVMQSHNRLSGRFVARLSSDNSESLYTCSRGSAGVVGTSRCGRPAGTQEKQGDSVLGDLRHHLLKERPFTATCRRW